MKAFRFFIAAATALMLCPAAALNARSRKEISPLAEKAASQHELCIEIGTICPMGMPSFTTTDGYKFTVKDGKVNADLPFFGESYTAIIPGADNPGITFKDCGIDIREDYSKAKKKGKSPYDYALDHDAMKHGRFNDTEVYADGEKLNEKQMLLCTLAQGQYVGGKFKCAPKSDNTDGLIDVCVLKTMTFLGLGLIIGTYTAGKHLDKKRKKIAYTRAKQIRFVAPKEIDVCIDGEMTKGKEFLVTCMPKAIKFVIPQE